MNRYFTPFFVILLCLLCYWYFVSSDSIQTRQRVATSKSRVEKTIELKIKKNTNSFDQSSSEKKTNRTNDITRKNPFSEKEVRYIIENRAMAKSSLAAGWAGLKALQTDHGRYSTDLQLLGLEPYQSVLSFVYGFIKEGQFKEPIAGEDISRMNSDYFVSSYDVKRKLSYAYSNDAGKINIGDFIKYCKMGCTATEDKFELISIFPYPGGKGFDVYILTHDKVMTLVHSDFK